MYVLYASRGIFFVSGGIISKSLIAGLIAIGIFVMIKYAPMFLKRKVFRPHFFLVFFYLLSWLFSDKEVVGRIGEAIGHTTTLDSLKCFLYANVTFYIFYLLTKIGTLTAKKLIFFAALLTIFSYINMVNNRTILMNMLEYEAQGMQMATGYVFAALLIYSLLIKNIKYRMVYMLPLLIFTMISAKRGAIVLAFILFVFILYHTYVMQSNRIKMKNVCALIIVLGVVALFVVDFISNNDFLMNRLDKTLEGDASNRQDMYPLLFSIISSPESIFHIFVGRGPAQTVNLIGNYAHNDWFEAMIDFGIVFVIAMLIFYHRMFRLSIYISAEYKNIIRLCLIYLLFKSLVSMGILSLESYIVMALMGYTLANIEKNETRIIINR